MDTRVQVRRRLALLAVLLATMVQAVPGYAVVATYTFTAGLTTVGVTLPQGTTASGVQVGTLPTQTDVKTRWPDGTIRFAAVSARIPTTGTYPLATATAPSGTFAVTWPTVTLALDIGGVTWFADAGAFPGSNLWLDGPVVREARVVIRPASGGTLHPLLEVVYDLRAYAGGGLRIDFTVQNVRNAAILNKVVINNALLTVDGSPLWSRGAVTSYSMTRWRVVVWSGGTEAQVTPDFEPTYLAAALPRVHPSVINGTYTLTGPNYDVMGGRPPSGFPAIAYGEMNPDMAAGGGRQEIGALNWWEAKYLVYRTQNQRSTVLRNADLTGAWSNHLTKADGTHIKLGDAGYISTWWWDIRGNPGERPLAPIENNAKFMGAREGLDTTTDTGSVQVASRYNEEHVPAPMYVAYLLTADRYYLDQGKFWSVKAITSLWPTWNAPDAVNFPGWRRGRNGATGNERLLDVSGMSREFGWPLRLVAYTTWMLPDTDPDRAYFLTTVQNNLAHAAQYYDLWVTLGYGGTLGAMGMEENPNLTLIRSGAATGRYSSMWRMSYTAYSLDWCSRQVGLWTTPASASAMVTRVVTTQVLMNLGNPNFLTGQAGLSYNAYPVFNTMGGGIFTDWFDSFAEVKSHNETHPYIDGTLGWPGGWNPIQPATGYYNTEHWMALQIALRRGVANAQTAIDRFTTVPGPLGDTLGRSGFAITFTASGTPPPPPPPPPPAPFSLRGLMLIRSGS